jgi:hypothetical protein
MGPTTATTAPGTITLLSRLAKVVYRRTPEELLGMRFRHFTVLSYLSEHDGVPQQELLLNELEAEDYAQRRRDPEDRRRHIVEITDNGRAALRRGERARETIEDSVLGALEPRERETLRRLLAKALEG